MYCPIPHEARVGVQAFTASLSPSAYAVDDYGYDLSHPVLELTETSIKIFS